VKVEKDRLGRWKFRKVW